jgi:hypothetical protein
VTLCQSHTQPEIGREKPSQVKRSAMTKELVVSILLLVYNDGHTG